METVPTIFVALVYHNVVPVVCAQLQYNIQKIRIAIVVGSFIPLVMFVTWNMVILGIAEPGTLSDPVELLRSGGAGEITGMLVSLFSEAAIITSFIGFIIGLMDFFTDIFPDRSKRDLVLFAAVLVPPLIVAIVDPDIFRGALDYAGTFGISILFGAIPALMAMHLRSRAARGESLSAPVTGTINEPLLYDQKSPKKSPHVPDYDRLVPGGRSVLYLVLLGTTIVIGQHIMVTFHLYQYFER
jgi:tyrosine-specific transport protein